MRYIILPISKFPKTDPIHISPDLSKNYVIYDKDLGYPVISYNTLKEATKQATEYETESEEEGY
jgi:hypothetical protein